MAKNKISGTAAAALFGGTPTNATRKPEDREQQSSESKAAELQSVEQHEAELEKQIAESEHPDWVRWMQARMKGGDKEHLFKTPYYITYAEAAADYAQDHPKDKFAQEMAEKLQREAAEKAKEDEEFYTKQKVKGKKGRPKKTDGSIGAYFVVDPVQYEKMQAIAKQHGLQMKQLVGKAFAMFLSSYETKYGEVTTFENGNIDNLI